MYFKANAAAALANPVLQGNLRTSKGKFVDKRAAIDPGTATTSRRTRDAARRCATACCSDLDLWLEKFETAGDGARRHRAVGEGRRRDLPPCDRHRAPARREEGRQVEVHAVRGGRAQPGAGGGGHPAGGDRSRRVHPADQRQRAALAHHRAGDPQEPRRGGRPVRAGAQEAAQDRHPETDARSARGAARALPRPPTWASPAATSSSPRPAPWRW